ncbi:MAG: DUF971 domain-containing protein [Chromatiales bacterium]|nr:DUF971 domain-containing protein [Gammaproteobacteria bacterium]MBW6477391.1 DUF971 domain-containing protein [Chromatiales bacterium]
MTDSHPIPTEITLHRERRVLTLHFDDGAVFELPCEYLRVYSPSAEVQGHHGEGAVLQVGKEAVNITDIQQIGQYAVKIFFDDKHRSGLFTWRYLYDLGVNQEAHWADYLARLKQAGHSHRDLK